MVLPEAGETAQKIRPPEERAICGSFSANDDVITTTGADVASIDHELFRAEPTQTSFLIQGVRVAD